MVGLGSVGMTTVAVPESGEADMVNASQETSVDGGQTLQHAQASSLLRNSASYRSVTPLMSNESQEGKRNEVPSQATRQNMLHGQLCLA